MKAKNKKLPSILKIVILKSEINLEKELLTIKSECDLQKGHKKFKKYDRGIEKIMPTIVKMCLRGIEKHTLSLKKPHLNLKSALILKIPFDHQKLTTISKNEPQP